MYYYFFDGSFAGLLTTIFEIYERRAWPDRIEQQGSGQAGLFAQTIAVTTSEVKAARVWQGLLKKVSANAGAQLYKTYLSELPEANMLIYQYMRLAFDSSLNIEENFAQDCVRQVAGISRQVFREKHRMEAFVRFRKTSDDLFYATIDPDFNVLPLLQDHFEKRYADQRWLIYDTKRNYGLYYDLEKVAEVVLDEKSGVHNDKIAGNILEQHEELYQHLWQIYFQHVNIPERKNRKLHLRHMPLRYWKYLIEKQPRVKPD